MLGDETLQKLYAWIDEVPLSRPKRNITRDFSDGVLTAEVLHHYFPKLVQLHNYSPANSIRQKQYNWKTLNQKVLKKLHFQLPQEQLDSIVKCDEGVIEEVLLKLQIKIANFQKKYTQQPKEVPNGEKLEADKFSSPPNSKLPSPALVKPLPSPGKDILHTKQLQNQVDTEILIEKEKTIQELTETVQILELKVQKLEQLVRLKDGKIQTLVAKLRAEQ